MHIEKYQKECSHGKLYTNNNRMKHVDAEKEKKKSVCGVESRDKAAIKKSECLMKKNINSVE